jgi:tetratricopeptide (TPR) repeat protein
MPSAALAAATIILALGGSLAVVLLTRTEPLTRQEAGETRTELAVKLGDLESRLAALQARLDAPAPETARSVVQPVTDAQIAAAVARYLAAHPVEAAAQPAGAAAARVNPKQTFMRLVDKNLSEQDAQAIWAELRKDGGLDEVIAMFEQHVAGLPNDPEAQVQLGIAYLQKLQGMNPGIDAGKLAYKVDGVFDTALKLDERNWEARYLKATSLSFWPAMFGKQAVAIEQLEILRGQQETGAPAPKFARTYLMLGNLYSQQGKAEKAKEVWGKGVALFPDHGQLREKLLK